MIEEGERERIDKVLREWRQGDFVLGEHWVLFRTSADSPITPEAIHAAEEDSNAAESEASGLLVITQTCDIVRSCVDRPFVQVCPLIEADAQTINEVQRGYRPQYASVPGLEDEGLIADLDEVMTVEKGVVADWDRRSGCFTDEDSRRLALVLARKRKRVAFPDDFASFAYGLQKRVSAKHDKNSPEGRALRALREIRVRAAPSWGADRVDVEFFFIRKTGEPVFEGQGWQDYLDRWLDLLPESDRFRATGFVVTLDDLTARDYVESDPLD